MRLPPLELASRRTFVSALTALGALTSRHAAAWAIVGAPGSARPSVKTSESYSDGDLQLDIARDDRHAGRRHDVVALAAAG